MADRIGVINKGELILVEDKAALMRKLGKKQLTLQLQEPLRAHSRRRSPTVPLELADDGHELVYTFDAQTERHRHRRAAAAARRARHRLQGPADAARARSRTSSSAWCRSARA